VLGKQPIDHSSCKYEPDLISSTSPRNILVTISRADLLEDHGGECQVRRIDPSHTDVKSLVVILRPSHLCQDGDVPRRVPGRRKDGQTRRERAGKRRRGRWVGREAEFERSSLRSSSRSIGYGHRDNNDHDGDDDTEEPYPGDPGQMGDLADAGDAGDDDVADYAEDHRTRSMGGYGVESDGQTEHGDTCGEDPSEEVEGFREVHGDVGSSRSVSPLRSHDTKNRCKVENKHCSGFEASMEQALTY
jgi:hypothetical protein